MGEDDSCDGWVLKEPMSAWSGEFKKRSPVRVGVVRDWNLLQAYGKSLLGLAEVGQRLGDARLRGAAAAAGVALTVWSALPEHGHLSSSRAQQASIARTPPPPDALLPWRSSCSRVTCIRCCSWTHPSPMCPPRAGSAKLRKPRDRPLHPCVPPTDPTAPAGPRAELRVSGCNGTWGGRGNG